MDVTRKMAEKISRSVIAEFTADTVDYAKTLALSALGAMIEGASCTGSDIVAGYVGRIGGAAEATLLGYHRRLPVESAALANASFAHATEYEDDSFPEAVSSYTIFPVIFALGEHLGSTGSDAIAAFVSGYETQARIGLACLEARRRGYMVLSLAGSIGCAAAAARLLRLDAQKTAHAISIAASQASGLGHQTGTMAHIIEMGFSARNGITAATLAHDGYTGKIDILEAPRGLFNLITANKVGDSSDIIRHWGEPYRILHVGIKEFPCCYHLQRIIEATLEVRANENVTDSDIVGIDVEVNAFFPTVVQHTEPLDQIQAQFSLPHSVAVAFMEPRVLQSSFAKEKINDPVFRAFRSRVKTIVREDWGWSPNDWTPRITFQLKDGRKLIREPKHARGQPPDLFKFDEALPKYRSCTEGLLSEKATADSVELVRALDSVDNIAEIMGIVGICGRKQAH